MKKVGKLFLIKGDKIYDNKCCVVLYYFLDLEKMIKEVIRVIGGVRRLVVYFLRKLMVLWLCGSLIKVVVGVLRIRY